MLGDTCRGSEGFCRARAALRGYGKNRSEGNVGGRKNFSTAGTAIIGGDGGSYTSDETPRRNREVVNPHTWPVCAKTTNIRRGEREPIQNSDLGVWYQPTQANTGDRRGTAAKPAGPDEEGTANYHGGEAARPSAVVFRGRLWQMRREIGVSIGAALAVLQGVVERGEKLEPPLDSRVVISHFVSAFERLVIRGDAKPRAPEVASKAFDGPDNAVSFQLKRSPVPLRIEGTRLM